VDRRSFLLAAAAAPLALHGHAFAYVTDCFGPSAMVRVRIGPLSGRNVIVIAALSAALKSVSSVRQTEPPMPFVCAAAETSERVVCAPCATTIMCDVEPDDVALDAVSETVYAPATL